MALSLAIASTATAQSTASQDPAAVALERLGLTLSDMVTRDPAVGRGLSELGREACDKTAIAGLGRALERVGYRREAAQAQIRFSETCNGHAPSLRAAVNILLNLSDYSEAAKVATALIALEPNYDNGYYLRAVAYLDGGAPEKAIGDFATAIELFGDKSKISSIGYTKMSAAYERLGRYCEAIVPIEAWIALNPLKNDTSQTRALITQLIAKGSCKATATAETTLKGTKRGNVTLVKAIVDGVSGVFVVDTGASFVSLKKSFADRAKIVPSGGTIKLSTANGITEGALARASLVVLDKLKVADVPVVIQPDVSGTYGPGVDGLLGMSVLGRFQMVVDGQTIKLRSRTGR